MRGQLKCWLVTVVTVAVAVSATGVSEARASLKVPHTKRSSRPGSQLWVKRYNGPGDGTDSVAALAVSPDGGTVFVTGGSQGTSSGSDYATVAYSAATGAKRWVSRYDGPAHADDSARSVAVSPDGGTVFVTGWSTGIGTSADYATVAYNAVTGGQLWVARYSGPANDATFSLVVSPDGDTVFVTGYSSGPGDSSADYATVAYDAVTGAQLWVALYSSRYSAYDIAYSLAVSPDGGTVYVTGQGEGTSGFDYATVAYDAATGAQKWVALYEVPGTGPTEAVSVAVSPDGATVYVTGESYGSTSIDYGTVAYDASTGGKLWAAQYKGPGNGTNIALSVKVSPGGGTVYVAGESAGATTGLDYATVAYNAVTGVQLWVKRYNGPGNGNDSAHAMAVNPTSGTVYVTGGSQGTGSGLDYATVAYRG